MGEQMSQWGSKFIAWPVSYSVSHKHNQLLLLFSPEHIGLRRAIKSTRISQRALGTVRLCWKALLCFILCTLMPYHVPRTLRNQGLLLGQLCLLRPMLFGVTQPSHHGNMADWTKAERSLNMEGAGSAGHVMWVVVAAIRSRGWRGRIAAWN